MPELAEPREHQAGVLGRHDEEHVVEEPDADREARIGAFPRDEKGQER